MTATTAAPARQGDRRVGGPNPDRSACAGTRHGDRTAYKAYGCRCADARTDKARHDKGRRFGITPPALVPSIGTSRKLQALAAIGWDGIGLAARLNTDRTYLRKVRAAASPTVTRTYADRVDRLYRQLQGTPGPSQRARTYAKRYGWIPPLGWDDIDDPAAKPIRGETRRRVGGGDPEATARLAAGEIPAREVSARERVAAVVQLATQGMSTTAIADRLRMSERSVQRMRREAS